MAAARSIKGFVERPDLSPVLLNKGSPIDNQVFRLANCDIGRTQVGRNLDSLGLK
jgi:hypothetical protein